MIIRHKKKSDYVKSDLATIFLLINMKAVISNFSVIKTHKSLKTLLGFLVIMLFFSCSANKPTNNYSGSKNIREEIVKSAKYLNGKRYKYGGISPRTGFDCSGLTYYIYKKNKIILPRTSLEQSKTGKKIKIKNVKPGDLIFFKNKRKINHVGIVIENKGNQIFVIHSTTSKGVKKDDVLNNKYWKKRITFARDVISR